MLSTQEHKFFLILSQSWNLSYNGGHVLALIGHLVNIEGCMYYWNPEYSLLHYLCVEGIQFAKATAQKDHTSSSQATPRHGHVCFFLSLTNNDIFPMLWLN